MVSMTTVVFITVSSMVSMTIFLQEAKERAANRMKGIVFFIEFKNEAAAQMAAASKLTKISFRKQD